MFSVMVPQSVQWFKKMERTEYTCVFCGKGMCWDAERLSLEEHRFSQHQSPVVQTLDSAIHRIKIYPLDNAIGFPHTYPLDTDLSGPTFEQLGPEVLYDVLREMQGDAGDKDNFLVQYNSK